MAKDSLWHEISEEEKEEIRKESKELLEKFGKKLEKIKASEDHYKNESGFREEGSPWKTDKDFRDLMFLNAPFVEEDHIVTEKGGWKK